MNIRVKRLLFLAVFFTVFIPTPFAKIKADENSDYVVKLDSENVQIPNINLEDFPDALNTKNIHLWKKASNINSSELSILKSNPHVETVQKEMTFNLTVTPDDQRYSTFGNITSGQYDQWDMRKIGLNPVVASSDTSGWEYSTGSSHTAVAVIDTGIDITHPDLAANLWVNSVEQAGTPGVDDDSNGYIDDINGWNFNANTNNIGDQLGHGTHVAGTIAAVSNNTIGIAGVCWNCRLMTLKVFGAVNSVGESTVAEAIAYAVDNGAKVINLSLSGAGYSGIMQDAINDAWDSGVLVVAAAGNNNGADSSMYSPGGLDHVITVGATDHTDAIASFSNLGGKVDLTAPGNFTLSTKFRTLGAGGCLNLSDYYCLSGTSMATPHVTGVAALLFDKHRSDIPAWDNLKVRAAILKNIDDKGTAGYDTTFGFGRLNALYPLRLSTLSLPAGVPTVSLDAPTNDYFSTHVTLTGSVNAGDLYKYSILFALDDGDTPLYNFTGRGNKSATTIMDNNVNLFEGEYTVTLYAEDFNGSVNDATPITLTIDTTPPATFSLSAPSTSWTTTQVHTFSWGASSDTSGQTVKYDLYVDSLLKTSNLTPTSYLLSETLSEGSHNWYVVAKDKAGNTRTSSTTQVNIDISPPNNFVPDVTIGSSTATFGFGTSDTLSAVEHYEYSLDSASFLTTTSPYTTPTISNGVHNMRLKAVDYAGNSRIVSTDFTIDSRFYMLKSAGDLSGDGTVELSDLSILATYWHTSNDSGDVNHDETVDISDLSILAQHWHQSF